MQAKEIIAKKRDGGANSREELEFLLSGYLEGRVKEYQMSAWLMAVFFRGMTAVELTQWTELMWRSGKSIPRLSKKEYWIDKHSTGGVGDKPSLILVPLVISVAKKLLGEHRLKIPMVSGRGLGHTGGTLDKLDAVPGFSPSLTMEKAIALLDKNDFFMMGQTESLAPADRLLYALRDVTGTVESIPLIVSSIMSKKLSESLDGIVFDIKVGRGAFMPTVEEAGRLAQGLLGVAKGHGLDGVALLTRMDEPLGWKVGNHLEVEECADFLKGKPRERGLSEVVLESASWLLHLGSRKKLSLAECKEACLETLNKGEAFSDFKTLFESQGGSWSAFEQQAEKLRLELKLFEFKSPVEGIISGINAKEIGVLLVDLGGGRKTKEDVLDYRVGLEFLKKTGEKVEKGETLVRVYYLDGVEPLVPRLQSVLLGTIEIAAAKTNPVSVPRGNLPNGDNQSFILETMHS